MQTVADLGEARASLNKEMAEEEKEQPERSDANAIMIDEEMD